ncbi:MAG: hypothetical protein BWY82_02305 [Verrucomicrobia bacterium ADurb.Bin474]|nr:MAG: hypothetical protein BWY82_02305 [Verrucomicrobia bacterium ADurb.Bin474]
MTSVPESPVQLAKALRWIVVSIGGRTTVLGLAKAPTKARSPIVVTGFPSMKSGMTTRLPFPEYHVIVMESPVSEYSKSPRVFPRGLQDALVQGGASKPVLPVL